MNFDQLRDLIVKKEGGYGKKGKDPDDAAAKFPCPTPWKGIYGYHTVQGITYATWVGVFGSKQDTRWYAMSNEDWDFIFRKRFLGPIRGTEFKSLNIAAVTLDMGFMSGAHTGVEILQRAVNHLNGKHVIEDDGNVGPATLAAVNACSPVALMKAIVEVRIAQLKTLCDDNTPQEIKNRKYINGWTARTKSYLTDYSVGISA